MVKNMENILFKKKNALYPACGNISSGCNTEYIALVTPVIQSCLTFKFVMKKKIY